MCYAANKVVKGEQLLEAIKKNKIQLVILATDMGASQKKKFKDKCMFYNVKHYEDILLVEEISKSCGNKTIVAIGFDDRNFIKLIEANI